MALIMHKIEYYENITKNKLSPYVQMWKTPKIDWNVKKKKKQDTICTKWPHLKNILKGHIKNC